MPKNPHKNELNEVLKLAGGKPVSTDCWGVAQLDGLLAKHRDIEAAVLRNELVELLKQIREESAALVGPSDLSERAQGLQSVAEDRSLYWSTDFIVTSDGYEESYRPKHPDAMKHEPIKTHFTMSFGAEDGAIAQMVQKVLDYGAFEAVDLPHGVGKVSRTGPEWIAPYTNNDQEKFSLGTPINVPLDSEIVTLDVRDEWQFSKGRFEGKILGRTSGLRGNSIQVGFGSCLTAVISLDRLGDGKPQGQMQFDLDLDGKLIDAAVYGIDMMEALQPQAKLEFYINGQKIALLQINNDRDPWQTDSYLRGVLDDLDVVQKASGLKFVLPATLTHWERGMLRASKLLLEGYSTWLPVDGIFNVELSGGGENSANLARDLSSEGRPFMAIFPRFPFEFQNSRVDLGSVRVASDRVIASNSDDLQIALAEEHLEGFNVRVKSIAPARWRAQPENVKRDAQGNPIFVSWNLPELDEPALTIDGHQER
ncbi:hypothetical protein AOZ07_01385 [Glutamicibacter halophytocola]|nr:hypothetical protein AOZ07_01385 [Glutamicibacter halophytocola]